MKGTDSVDILDVANRVDAFWGHRLRGKEVARSSGWYRVLVYDAFMFEVAIDGDSLKIEADAVEPTPGLITNLSVPFVDLGSVLEQLDAKFRAALPARYLEAFDSWVARENQAGSIGLRISPQERRARLVSDRPEALLPAGPAVGPTEIVDILRDRFGDRVRVIGEVLGDRVDAELDGTFHVAIERDAQYGAVTAGILLRDRAIVTLFGERLIARHSDERSVRELLDVIDRWVTLRLSR